MFSSGHYIFVPRLILGLQRPKIWMLTQYYINLACKHCIANFEMYD